MSTFVATGFDFPMASDLERRSRALPPGNWNLALGFLAYYNLGYHTGLDMTLEPGGGRGQIIHACANGEITFAERMRKPGYEVWGNLIIQRCYLPDGKLLYIRYAHSNPLLVKAGDSVRRGQPIALESDAFGVYYPHLHLDFSPTSILFTHPEHWPGQDRAGVEANYIDPLAYIRGHRPMGNEIDQIDAAADEIKALTAILRAGGTPLPPTAWTGAVVGLTLNVRDAPSTSGHVLKQLAKNDPLQVSLKPEDVVTADAHTWVRVLNPMFLVRAWVAGDLLPIPNL